MLPEISQIFYPDFSKIIEAKELQTHEILENNAGIEALEKST